ncbi:MAG: D-alanyl-D-alanine carboxypeptidase/D-alanyl-D-alanine-endopeptidase [Gammaproteobacteria bacterium]|jgi:serine-type D-Ala-D-Ala carboxypeptidase/endopeptidase (penicillin-binding protein 4)|nr:D-alanyl-D-alanine carboxypeptidase/D-alanyl-D-alanine-endopeptidase [Gammaproteobacteria bacterium]
MSKNIFCKSLFALLLVFFIPAAIAQQQSADLNSDIGDIPENVDVVIDGHDLPESSFSFMVQEIGASVPILAHNADTPFNPASSIKTLTTLAALDTLGPAFNWQTELYALGPVSDGVLEGDLLMKGGGDPFLVEDQLRNMLKALQRTGIEHITGNLILDGSYFDPTVEQGEVIDNQNGRSYNTEPNAVISNFQSVNFYFQPHPNGRDVVILTDPQLPNLKITNRLRLVNRSCGGYQRGVSFNRNDNDPSEVIFEGQFPSGCTQYRMVREVLNAPGYTFGLFTQLWGELGGQLDGSLGVDTVPEELEPVLTWSSLPLSDVVKSINKFSNNLMTRHLLLTLGAETFGSPATVEKGVEAIESYLEMNGMDSSQLILSNGSGLSRDTRISTALMNEILRSAWASPYMPEYVASLPINGMDGTMRTRLRGTNMSGRMHIKTGSLNEVSAIAGFVYSRSNKTYAVTGIINHELADRGPGAELMDALLTWVYQQ